MNRKALSPTVCFMAAELIEWVSTSTVASFLPPSEEKKFIVTASPHRFLAHRNSTESQRGVVLRLPSRRRRKGCWYRTKKADVGYIVTGQRRGALFFPFSIDSATTTVTAADGSVPLSGSGTNSHLRSVPFLSLLPHSRLAAGISISVVDGINRLCNNSYNNASPDLFRWFLNPP